MDLSHSVTLLGSIRPDIQTLRTRFTDFDEKRRWWWKVAEKRRGKEKIPMAVRRRGTLMLNYYLN
jgi:hypothetical protein